MPEPHLWDEGHLLSSHAREELERRLTAAEKKSGAPLYLLVTDRIHGDSAAEVAAAAFAAHALGTDPTRNAVLLVVAIHGGAAAVETGKGNAGIVPEIDARRIAKQLKARLSSRHPETAIGQAITELATSARATAARRTPLPREHEEPDEPEPPPAEVHAAIDAATGADGATTDGRSERADAGLQAEPGTPANPPARGRRSRLPIAIGIAVLVVLGLGLRRRKQVAASREGRDDDRPKRF